MAENTIMQLSELTEAELARHGEAVELHRTILTDAELAATSLIRLGNDLKRMRDSKLYEALGFESFEDYTKRAIGIGQRQAYYHISVVEKLPPALIEENASAGITKLELITHVPEHEREEFLEKNDLESSTVAELREQLKQYQDQSEQLSLYEQELDEVKRQLAESSAGATLEVAAAPDDYISPEEHDAAIVRAQEKARADARAEAEKEFKAKLAEEKKKAADAAEKKTQKERETAVEAAKSEAAEKLKQNLTSLEAEKKAAIERAQELEKKLAVAANPAMVKFAFYADELQKTANAMLDIITRADAEGAAKMRGALTAVLDVVRGKV